MRGYSIVIDRWAPMKSAYDIIVVGAGAAGCAAARACALQHKGASIALIEQGQHQYHQPHQQLHRQRRLLSSAMMAPALQPLLRWTPKGRRCIEILSSDADANLAGRPLHCVVGHVMGGSSLVNDMRYVRGTRADFDSWQTPTWSFDALLPFYRRIEANTRGASLFHGADGPLTVSDVQRCNADAELNVRFFEACEAAGLHAAEDINAGTADGYTIHQSCIDGGARVDVSSSLLYNTKEALPNLTVLTGTRVGKVLFNGKSVSGVEVVHRGSLAAVASGVVILCAGALRSPALLMRSGVGLHGDVVANEQVGQNLILCPTVDLTFSMARPRHMQSKALCLGNVGYLRRQWAEYCDDRTGAFSSLVEAGAYLRSQPQVPHPDLSLLFFRTSQMNAPLRRLADGFTMRVTHHYPEGRGSVQLRSCGGGEELVIRSGILSSKKDVLAMDEGIQWAGLLTSRDGTLRSVHHVDEREQHVSPFWSFDVRLSHPSSGLATQRDTAAFLAQYARNSSDIFGTCAMEKVVDAQLRVFGVDGLLVADASIVPTPTVASSHVLGAAIGTRVASFV